MRIDNIAQLERGLGPSTLQRFNRQFSVNLNRRRRARATRSTRRRTTSAKMLTDLELPPGYSFRLQRADARFSTRPPTNLMMAIGLASIFVYMVLAAQFESFVQPIVIMRCCRCRCRSRCSRSGRPAGR